MFGRTRKDITIFKKYEENLLPAAVDQSQVEQVLLNIFVNAWQAMPEGGDLYVQTKNEILDENFVRAYGIRPGKYVAISITDTGIGMDEQILKKVLDPFFTTKDMGTGLGLGIVKNIVESHAGSIQIVNRPIRGTRVTIELPVKQKADDNEEISATRVNSNLKT